MLDEPLPVRGKEFRWSAKEVVRNLHGAPHLLVRVTLSGTHFTGSSPEPFLRIGDVRSRFVLIGDDGMHAHAYFDTDPPDGGAVELGYGRRVKLLFPRFRAGGIERLDRARLPEGIRISGAAGDEGAPSAG